MKAFWLEYFYSECDVASLNLLFSYSCQRDSGASWLRLQLHCLWGEILTWSLISCGILSKILHLSVGSVSSYIKWIIVIIIIIAVIVHCLVTKSCLTLCDPMNCSTLGFPTLHCLSEFAQTHVHWVGDAIQPSHPLLPSSPPALNLSQHQDLCQWVSSLHQVAKVLEPQLQHQSFQWIFRDEHVLLLLLLSRFSRVRLCATP